MPLVTCTECGSQVSDKAAACPKCGCPVEQQTSAENVPTRPPPKPRARAGFLVAFAVVALGIGGFWYSKIRAEEQRLAIEAEAKRQAEALAAHEEQERLRRITEERQRITTNPGSVLEASDFRSYDKGFINSYRELTALNVLNKSKYALRNISGRVEWLTDEGAFVGASPMVLKGSIPAGDTKHFSSGEGTLQTGTIQGSASKVRIVFVSASIVD